MGVVWYWQLDIAAQPIFRAQLPAQPLLHQKVNKKVVYLLTYSIIFNLITMSLFKARLSSLRDKHEEAAKTEAVTKVKEVKKVGKKLGASKKKK